MLLCLCCVAARRFLLRGLPVRSQDERTRLRDFLTFFPFMEKRHPKTDALICHALYASRRRCNAAQPRCAEPPRAEHVQARAEHLRAPRATVPKVARRPPPLTGVPALGPRG